MSSQVYLKRIGQQWGVVVHMDKPTVFGPFAKSREAWSHGHRQLGAWRRKQIAQHVRATQQKRSRP